MRNRLFVICLSVGLLAWASPPAAAQTITSVEPRTCKPGKTTLLTIRGTDLDDSLRLVSIAKSLDWKIESVEPTLAVVAITLPDNSQMGPHQLWLTTAAGAITKHLLLIDDLDAVRDHGDNHTIATAQEISTRSSIEGVCDASLGDFYRIRVSAGQRVAVEVHTQSLRSPMDPMLRLLDAAGKPCVEADDTPMGPDCRFSYEFASEGEYWIEVRDSRNAAGGAAYQLRVGDFPIITQCSPLAIRGGETSSISFAGPDANLVSPRDMAIPDDNPGVIQVRAKLADGESSSWLPLHCSEHPQIVESSTDESLTPPIGISGRLEQPREVDSYPVRGVKGQVIRFTAKARSLGSPTVLQMKLFSAAGGVIAETSISDADSWSFDATLPDDGDYRLDVTDLLNRGGDEFNYWVEIIPAGSFTVALKADAATREEFSIETQRGACAVDLQISRFGFDGEIDLSFSQPLPGLRLLNPRIPAAAETARIFLTVDEAWTPASFDVLELVATSVQDPRQKCRVNSHALRRLREPHVLAPATQDCGEIVLAATTPTDSPFAIEPVTPIQFARPVRSHLAKLALKRMQPEFKAGVDVLPTSLPAGWNLTATPESDTYAIAFVRDDQVVDEPTHLPLRLFAEFNGRGRIEAYEMPVQWIDPVAVTLEFSEPIIRGGLARGSVQLLRQGNDPQPVTIAIASLPPGITGADSITIAGDQTSAEWEIQVGADAAIDTPLEIAVIATSKFDGQDFTVRSTHALPQIVAAPTSLVVYPSEIRLDDARGRQRLAVTGLDEHQSPRDWTRHSRITSSDPRVVEVRGGVVYPIADGDAEVFVDVGNQRQVISVHVTQMQSPRKIEFESEVLVSLSKQGCNAGACHGSPSGKGGFRLSLRAFDKQLDELTLIREDFGRRINLVEPEKSLLLLKPLMGVAHGGGKQLHQQDAAYDLLRDWIAGGATTDAANVSRVTRLEVYPNQKQILAVADGGQQLAVTAIFEDGRRRDVTHLVAYETSDTSVASVDASGWVIPYARGEVAILVRFLEHIESVPLMFVEKLPGFEWESPPTKNYVDEWTYAKLKQLQYLPSPTCNDDEFLRRVSLDVLGILPSLEETNAFLADTAEDKRQRLIDSLLQRDEYAKFWALKWGDLLKMTSKLVGDEGVYKYNRWVEQSLRDNVPYDDFAKQLLTASGSTLANPPANFYRTSSDMNECVETISQVFLGARLQCAKCHNHPFERWTQDNYYGLGAFFNRVQRRSTQRPGEMFIYTAASGDVTQPRTGKVMSPWLPQSKEIDSRDEVDRRETFANWLIDAANPYFSRIEANRIWSQLFERGIVDPIDDFRDSNPPSNGPLLDALADDFVASGYDRKHLLRVILNSRTYQASYQTNEFNADDTQYFSHQEPRLLSAEQLLDAINRTLDVQQTFGSLPAGTLATQLPAPDVVKVEFLKVFGQPERSTVCACERADDSNLGMAIELFNGPVIHEKLRDANNRFRKGLAAGKSVDEVIRDLYLAAVCRPPSEIEWKAAVQHCGNNPDPVAGLEDVCWALFNTDEFLFQH